MQRTILFGVAGLLTSLCSFANASCDLEVYNIGEGDQITVVVAPEYSIDISIQGDDVLLKNNGAELAYFPEKVSGMWSTEENMPHRIMVSDIDKNGYREIWIGTWHAQVNFSYNAVIITPNNEVWSDANLTNPEFCEVEGQVVTTDRSGPRTFTTLWNMNTQGGFSTVMEQANVDSRMDRRMYYDEYGQYSHQTIVPPEHPLSEDDKTVTAKVMSDIGEAPLFGEQDSQQEVSRIKNGDLVTLIGADNTFSRLEVTTQDGQRGWVEGTAIAEIQY